jgi:P27 family predicted phage terminase small subunit
VAKRGRKPKATNLKLVGGAQADRIMVPPTPRGGKAEPPPHLEGVALAEWERIVAEVEATRVMTPADATALAIYAVCFARWLDALREIQSSGLVVVSDTGVAKANPAVAIASKCEARMQSVLSSFGLDPSSRSRVSPIEDPAEADPLGEFLRKG